MNHLCHARLLTLLLAMTPMLLVAQSEDAPIAPPPGDAPPATDAENDPNAIHVMVERMPEFPGGQVAMMTYLQRNLRYPSDAEESNIEGRVFLSFVVERDGSITQAKVLRGVHSSLDREALRVVNSMPKWAPGEQGGKPVRTQFNLPVMFKLAN